MNTILITLGAAVFFFAIIKTLFGFLAWLFPEADTYRAQLDSVIDMLDTHSIFEVGRLVLRRAISPVQQFFSRRLRGYLTIGVISLLLNGVVFVLASTAAIAYYFSFFSDGIDATVSSIETAGVLNFTGMTILVGLLATAFDLLSLTVTMYLLTQASLAKTSRSLASHLGVDLLVATVSCMWAYGILDITLHLYYEQMLPYVDHFSFGSPDSFIRVTLWETLKVSKAMWYVVLGLGISAALPTVLYVIALIPILLLRVTPPFVQRGLTRVLYLVTTDDQPVLRQVATFASGVRAIIGGVIGWVKIASI